MTINIFQTILGGFVASIIWFIIGSILYLNPLTIRIYKNAEISPALKKWSNVPKYVCFQYIGILIQCLIWSFIFAYLKPFFPENILIQGVFFGMILVAVKIFPRLFDTWIQTTYPNKLLVVEFFNGTIGSFVIGLVFAYII
jgi:hypothetical protein